MAAHTQAIGKVTGHLEKRRDYWHMVVSWVTPTGDRQRKSKSSNLPIKNNKKRAEEMLNEYILFMQKNIGDQFSPEDNTGAMLFGDYVEKIWLIEKEKSQSIRTTTLACYESTVKSILAPYFRDRRITLIGLTEKDVEEYYALRLQTVKATTVHKSHIILNGAIKLAVKNKLIPNNIMTNIQRPKAKRYRAQFFTESEVISLFEACQGDELEIPILFGAYYGLRRSEIVGLRWDSINFETNTLTIEHTVTKTTIHGKRVLCVEDMGKSDSSLRTLPLIPAFKEKLLNVKLKQQQNKKRFGSAYNKKDDRYICTDPLGNLINPDFITTNFPSFLEKHKFRRIRFHDLRHSCASLLIANDVPLIQIKDWLGHSEIGVTADIYGHLEYKSKLKSVEAMDWIHQTTVGKVPTTEGDL